MGFLNKIKAYLDEEPEEYDESGASASDDSEAMSNKVSEDASEDESDKKLKTSQKKSRKKARDKKQKKQIESDEIKELYKEIKSTKANQTAVNEKTAVKDFCEQLIDVSYHMEDMKREYNIVTGYLMDVQRIEELPIEIAEEINDVAKSIDLMEKDREKYVKSENLLSQEQYNTIATYEDDILKSVKELNEMEMRDAMLKNDMGYLEGEKDDLAFMRDEYSEGMSRIRGVMIGAFFICFTAIAALLAYALVKRESVTMYSLIVGAFLVIVFVISYIRYNDYKRDIKDIDAKQNRAISLLNKVKVKYINNVNALDYIYDKYNVNSCKELEYLWDNYNIMVQDAVRYSRANKDFRMFCDMLIQKLRAVGIEDPEVWTKQTNALIDRRELVEIKHGLIKRRQGLRDKLLTCTKIKDNATVALKAAVEERPDLREYVTELLASYRLNI